MGKQFGAFDHSRSRPGEIGIGIHRVDAAILNRRIQLRRGSGKPAERSLRRLPIHIHKA